MSPLEEVIVRVAIREARKVGYVPIEAHDGGEWVAIDGFNDSISDREIEDQVIGLIDECEEPLVYFYNPQAPEGVEPWEHEMGSAPVTLRGCTLWARFILGNGRDIISDNSFPKEIIDYEKCAFSTAMSHAPELAEQLIRGL